MVERAELIEHVNTLISSTSIEDVWKMHVARMREFGFDRMIYGSTRFRTHGEFGDVSDALVLTNHDKAYMDIFFGRELYLVAPMAVWAAHNTGACSWQWARDRQESGSLTEREVEVMDINEKMGVNAGYSIAFPDSSHRSKGGIGLCARAGLTQRDVDILWAKDGAEILMLNYLMNLKITNLPYTGMRQTLTNRQREVLQWVADGKTMQDIAVILDLNTATIEKHLRLARENLNVETTAQAVVKASIQNQFFLFEGQRIN